MLVNKGKEAFSYVCFHVLAVWRVVPYDVSLSVFAWVWCLAGGFIVGEVVVVTAFVECFLMKRTKIIIAGNQTRAPWMETATPKTSYTKLKSQHQPQEKLTSGFATPNLN